MQLLQMTGFLVLFLISGRWFEMVNWFMNGRGFRTLKLSIETSFSQYYGFMIKSLKSLWKKYRSKSAIEYWKALYNSASSWKRLLLPEVVSPGTRTNIFALSIHLSWITSTQAHLKMRSRTFLVPLLMSWFYKT